MNAFHYSHKFFISYTTCTVIIHPFEGMSHLTVCQVLCYPFADKFVVFKLKVTFMSAVVDVKDMPEIILSI